MAAGDDNNKKRVDPRGEVAMLREAIGEVLREAFRLPPSYSSSSSEKSEGETPQRKKPSSWSFHRGKKPHITYRDRQVKFDSDTHLKLLHGSLEHLLALRDAYPPGSANRHVMSQVCTRLKRLIKSLEKNDL